MIPKVIHYCWFGKGEKPELALKCIESWKKYCPDYEIKEWNEDNFDINSNQYVKEAYEAKKWAFVTDYVRLYALYTEGGIYMDTDVEVIKNLDKFLEKQAFSSFENNNMIPTGLMASRKHNKWIKDLLDEYANLHFFKPDGTMDMTTNVYRITNLTIQKYGLNPISSYQNLKGGIVTLYPYDYFCPKSWETGIITITNNTHTIHHFAGSWIEKDMKERNELKIKYINKFGKKKGVLIGNLIFSIKHPIKMLKVILNKRRNR